MTEIKNYDWKKTQELLVAGSIPAFKNFFKVHPLETIRAIGYTWEWGQPQAAFYCVANTEAGIEQALAGVNRYRTEPLGPAEALETICWDAGYFPFPAGLTGPNDEMGARWEEEAAKLHAILEAMRPTEADWDAEYENYSKKYDAFLALQVTACCGALADIARTGLFGDFAKIDFWVGSTDDKGDIVRDRNTRIRHMIAK